MPDEAPVGRARVSRPLRGRARVGRPRGTARLPERAVTEIIRRDGDEPPPVFVDPSGARRRRVRRTAYAIGVLLVLLLLVIWGSQLTRPARPLVPCPSATACVP